MLKWYEENGKYLGFEDDTFLYRVCHGADGWEFESVIEMCGYSGYDTAQEAMEAAEADYEYHEGLKPEAELDELLDVLTDEDDYWDAVAHERMEAERVGW